MKTKRKVCILTGSRADYGLLKPVIKAVVEHPKLESGLIVAGMHFSQQHNNSAAVVEGDGWKIYGKVPMGAEDGTNIAMAREISIGVERFSQILEKEAPDFFLVLGDRYETLAGVIAAAYMNIIVAHIHGGDKTAGGLDESARHAITKFAHIHFPATALSAGRILKMGEDDWRIFTVGSPAIDNIINCEYPARAEILKKYSLKNEPYLVLVQHAVSTQANDAGKQIQATLSAIAESRVQTVAIYPNTDAGYRDVTAALEKARGTNFHVFQNLSQHFDYLCLLKHAGALIGNSSGGMTEAASFNIPVINIGDRQKGRERADNVLDVPHDREQIKNAIQKALHDGEFLKRVQACVNPYGDGNAGNRIADILATIELPGQLLQKQITY